MGLNNYMPPENRKRQKVYPRIGLFYRSTRPDVFCKKGVLRNLGKFTGKRPCQNFYFNKVAGLACNFIKIETLAQVFSCEFCEISKNTFSTEHLLTAASVLCIHFEPMLVESIAVPCPSPLFVRPFTSMLTSYSRFKRFKMVQELIP